MLTISFFFVDCAPPHRPTGGREKQEADLGSRNQAAFNYPRNRSFYNTWLGQYGVRLFYNIHNVMVGY